MKKISSLIYITLVTFAINSNSFAQTGFTLKIRLVNPKQYKLVIGYDNGNGQNKMDTNYVMQNGYMVFKGNSVGVNMLNIIVRNPNLGILAGGGFIPGPQLSCVIRNGATLTINGDSEKPFFATVKSSERETMTYEAFRDKDKIFVSQIWSLKKQSSNASTAAQKAAGAKIKLLETKQRAWAREFVRKYPQSFAAIQVFATYALDIPAAQAAKEFAQLPGTYKKSGLGAIIAEKMANDKATAVGKPIISFSQKGFDGKLVNLASLKGKVVLLDFWGSWCVPCRNSFPHLKQLYTKYKQQGFEIIGVAQENGTGESQIEAWKTAIKSDGVNWLNVINDPAQIDIVKKYGVVVFPTKILIDKSGIIRYKSVGDQEGNLEKKIVALLAGY